MNIKQILRGCNAGEPQSVGVMTVIPLISDITDDRFVSPVKTKLSNSNYGEMKFKNEEEKVLIVPLHTGYLTKESHQNHAIPHIGMVKGKSTKSYNDCACIQQSQSGTIPEKIYDMMILPYALREKALATRHENNYNKLWQAISNFNKDSGLTQTGHLELFYDKFKEELDLFIAEFEIVPKQIGAIILLSGKVAGIERTPSYQYWTEVWQPLVRECYGSLAIQISKGFKFGKSKLDKFKIPLSTNVETLDDIEKALAQAKEKQNKIVKDTVRELLEDPFEMKEEEAINGFQAINLENDQFSGQAVLDESQIVYASLFTKQKWVKEEEWRKAEEFKL